MFQMYLKLYYKHLSMEYIIDVSYRKKEKEHARAYVN